MSRDCACEQTRMVNIWQSLQVPVTFIRYNPDKFRYTEGERRQEHITKATRLDHLKRWLDHILENGPKSYGANLNVLYLFFDGYDESRDPVTIQ